MASPEQLDAVYDQMDDLFRAGKFAEADEILRKMDVGTLDEDLVIAYLTASLPAKRELKARVDYYDRCAMLFIGKYPLNEAEDTMRGLEQ